MQSLMFAPPVSLAWAFRILGFTCVVCRSRAAGSLAQSPRNALPADLLSGGAREACASEASPGRLLQAVSDPLRPAAPLDPPAE